jgi:hypothetical protein
MFIIEALSQVIVLFLHRELLAAKAASGETAKADLAKPLTRPLRVSLGGGLSDDEEGEDQKQVGTNLLLFNIYSS